MVDAALRRFDATFWHGRWGHVPRTVVALAFLYPVAVMLIGSLRRPGSPPTRSASLLVSDPSFESYADAFDLVDLAVQLRNSLVVATTATGIAVVASSLAGFVIVRSTPRVARALVGLAVIAMVLPPTALVIGRFSLYRSLGLLDTYVPLIAPGLYGVNSLAVLLYGWSFSRLPPSLFEAAELEGVGPLAMWRRIALPLTRPMSVAVATLAFAASWSDFLSPLVFLTSEELYTVPLGLRSLQLVGGQDIPVLLAGCVVATVPVLVVFAATQRWLFASVRGAT